MTAKPNDPFFVGYFKKVPKPIAALAMAAAAAITGILIAEALILPLGAGDPGAGRYANDLQGARLDGVIDRRPYPILRTPAHGDTPARAYLLGGQSKTGVEAKADALGLQPVEVGGVFVRRGDLTMLLAGPDDMTPGGAAAAGFRPAASEDLGHWRLTGEICDGKCYAGAMKPGRGLAHKACANLCIQTGLPPVLVMELPVAGKTVVLLAAEDGGPMPDALFDLTARPVEMEGRLERRDDLLILRIDHDAVRPL